MNDPGPSVFMLAVHALRRRHPQIQHEQRERNAEHAVAERCKAIEVLAGDEIVVHTHDPWTGLEERGGVTYGHPVFANGRAFLSYCFTKLKTIGPLPVTCKMVSVLAMAP